ncbi:MAG TPA: hypothetical protein DCS28_03345 [Candidatus Moranbacteria bacterium]|nr:hypothetical protein [Candidatus Moranbacteria bacterium]HAT75047.1 hypothetical protein [Candidatus Moranbacteria bacterium]
MCFHFFYFKNYFYIFNYTLFQKERKKKVIPSRKTKPRETDYFPKLSKYFSKSTIHLAFSG